MIEFKIKTGHIKAIFARNRTSEESRFGQRDIELNTVVIPFGLRRGGLYPQFRSTGNLWLGFDSEIEIEIRQIRFNRRINRSTGILTRHFEAYNSRIQGWRG